MKLHNKKSYQLFPLLIVIAVVASLLIIISIVTSRTAKIPDIIWDFHSLPLPLIFLLPIGSLIDETPLEVFFDRPVRNVAFKIFVFLSRLWDESALQACNSKIRQNLQ
jgi:hypothetical protein